MKVEILSTGNEVVSGTIADTNAAHIASRIEEAGMAVTRHVCVGDNLDQIAGALCRIAGRVPLAVVTGGLGPTADDLTAEAAARAVGRPLVRSSEALCVVERFFKRLGRTISDANLKQALLPEGARCLDNPKGSAPGFTVSIGRCVFFFLPGVPVEMKAMLTAHVLPWIQQQSGNGRSAASRALSTFGMPEAELGQRLERLTGSLEAVRLGTRLRFPMIDIRLQTTGSSRAVSQERLAIAAQQIADALGEYVVSTRGASMEAVVGELLREKGATLAVAESCTGGLIASRLTDVAGSSDYFLLSAVTYSNAAKTSLLGVSPETVARNGAVHETTVREMAQGVRSAAGADFGLATSGIAGPGGGTDDKPVGTVCLGLATAGATFAIRFHSPFKDRLANKAVFAVKALDMLRRELLL